MSAVWTAIAVTAVITVAIKAAGPLLLGRRELPPRAAGVVGLLPAVLLCALVIVSTASEGGRLELDPRIAGVAAAGLALRGRAPTGVVLALAAGVTALLRAVT